MIPSVETRTHALDASGHIAAADAPIGGLWATSRPAPQGGWRYGGCGVVLTAEHRGDARKRAVLRALRAASMTPLEPEDVFALSRGVDSILDYPRDLVAESEALACLPDMVIAEMARLPMPCRAA